MSRPITPEQFAVWLEFFKTFDLTPLPVDILNKLKPGKAYDIDIVYDRLRVLNKIDCELEFFKLMLDQEEGFRVEGDYVFREGKAEPENIILDPDIE